MSTRPAVLAATCTLLSLLACPVLGAEDVYRWVDANGVVHYSQVAPRGVAYERVAPSGRSQGATPSFYNPVRNRPSGGAAPASAAPSAPASNSTPLLTENQQQRQTELAAQAQARLAEIAAVRRENCSIAREQFSQFTTYARIRIADGEGGERVITEEERQERIVEAQEAIVLNCDDAG